MLRHRGKDDVLTLAHASDGQQLGLDQLGFFGHGDGHFDAAVAQIKQAGSMLRRHDDDLPTAFFADPDGFPVKIRAPPPQSSPPAKTRLAQADKNAPPATTTTPTPTPQTTT